MNTLYVVSVGLSLLVLLVCKRSRRAKKAMVHVNPDNCRGCGCCVQRCRHKVLVVEGDGAGRRCVVAKFTERCSACGNCVATCRFGALALGKRTIEKEHEP